MFVDWSNVRLSLACGRHRAGPTWTLRALVDAVRRATAAGGGLTVALYLTPATELRADRALLRAVAGHPDIVLRHHTDHGDLSDVALALGVCGVWHDGGDGDIAVVSDQRELAFVVSHFARLAGRGREVRLLHLHDRPPLAGDGRARTGRTRHLRLALDPPAERRAWTGWDQAAWALRRLASFVPDAIADRALRPPAGQSQRELWRRAEVEHVAWERLERVDGLVADLWRLDWGRPFGPRQATAEVERRLGHGAGDAGAVLEALLVAQLVRWHDPDRLEVPSSWREGLLLPARRAVLRLAGKPGFTHPLDRLERRHRQRFLTPPAEPAVPGLEQASRSDSWRWVKHALRDRLRVVAERTERRPGHPSSRATWRLVDGRFARDTIGTAERIREQLRSPRTVAELEEAIGEPAVWRLSRWLRCLRDVGLVDQRDGRLVRSRAELHTPE